ncbi:MAG: hypothetical protein L3J74_17690, partial [Bacteroidales bacterium]|nr:hypothetical protein [Bacteroidales bacterium]
MLKFLSKYIVLLSVLTVFVKVTAQDDNKEQKVKMITIVHSDSVNVNEETMPGIQFLRGNVVLKHDSAYMYCDSAYFDGNNNSFVAINNIKIITPTEDALDTVYLYSDSLHYSGQEKLAEVRYNVVMVKDSMTLYTENLDYKVAENIGYYFDGGRTLNGQDTLISKYGYYYADLDELYFKDSVIVQNPKYTIYSDTLEHQTVEKISYLLGPTHIISKDTTSWMYSEFGWYNHLTDIGKLTKNPLLVDGKKTLKGDSILYNRNTGLGIAYHNVTIADSVQNIRLKGNLGKYYEKSESSVITDSALFISIQEKDSLFLHADTIHSIIDTLITKTDTTSFRLIKSYHKVKIFRKDFQAKCDSLVYTFLDSTIKLYYEPVFWSGTNQMTADYIEVQTDSNKVNQIIMQNNALIAAQVGIGSYNQIKGKKMIAHLRNNEIYLLDVLEDGGTIYYTIDKNLLIGINKISCTN